MTRLRPASRVRIESVRLHGADGRVVLVGARLYGPPHCTVPAFA